MKKTAVDTFLQQFNTTIDQWIAFLDDYTLDMLCQKPGPGSWSLGQVYRHIIADTTFFMEQMGEAAADNANNGKEMQATAKTMFSNNAFPDRKLENPANDPDMRQPQSKAELLQDLITIKNEVNRLFNSIDLSSVSGKTQHPGLGFFTAPEWLQFAGMHMRHHFRQKKSIDEVNWPEKNGKRKS